MKEAFLIEKNLTSGMKLTLACALLCGDVMTQNDGGSPPYDTIQPEASRTIASTGAVPLACFAKT